MLNRKILFALCVSAVIASLIFSASFADEKNDSRIKRYISELHDRQSAARARSDLTTVGKTAVPYLLELVESVDEKESVRVLAINTIKEIGDTSATPWLIPFLKDKSVKVRQAVAKTLGELKNKSAVSALREAITDYDPTVRFFAVRSLEQIGDSAAYDTYIAVLKDPDARIRLFAVKGLGNVKDTRSVKDLSQLTADSDANVRLALATTLGEIADVSCIDSLAFLINSDPHPNVRAQAVDSVSAINNPRTIEILMKVAGTFGEENMRYHAVLGLEKLKSEKSTGVLSSLLTDESTRIRITSASALAAVGTREANDALKNVLYDESSGVRAVARQALGVAKETAE